MAKFKAYRISTKTAKVQARLVGLALDQLDAGEVVIKKPPSQRQLWGCPGGNRHGQDHPAFPASADRCGNFVALSDPASRRATPSSASYDLGWPTTAAAPNTQRRRIAVGAAAGIVCFVQPWRWARGYTADWPWSAWSTMGLPANGPVIVTVRQVVSAASRSTSRGCRI
jgi:hypothetical protein